MDSKNKKKYNSIKLINYLNKKKCFEKIFIFKYFYKIILLNRIFPELLLS